jgi:hypothetical protein
LGCSQGLGDRILLGAVFSHNRPVCRRYRIITSVHASYLKNFLYIIFWIINIPIARKHDDMFALGKIMSYSRDRNSPIPENIRDQLVVGKLLSSGRAISA